MCRKFSAPAVYQLQRYQFHLWFHLFLVILHPLQKAKHFPVRFEQPLAGTPASLSHFSHSPSKQPFTSVKKSVPFTECTAASSSVILSLLLTTYRKILCRQTAQLSSTVKEKKVTIVCFVFKLEFQISCSVLTSISLVMVQLDWTHSQMLLLKTSCISGCLVS